MGPFCANNCRSKEYIKYIEDRTILRLLCNKQRTYNRYTESEGCEISSYHKIYAKERSVLF